MSIDRSTRRDFLRGAATASALIPAAMLLGCGKKAAVCNDPGQLSSLSEADRTARNVLKYVDTSTEANKTCSNCLQFQPAGDNQCGTCKVVKGPVAPTGYCSTWAQKPA
jgi:hypothetical protein